MNQSSFSRGRIGLHGPRWSGAVAVLLAAGLAACSSSPGAFGSASAPTVTASGPAIEISGAWAAPSKAVADAATVFAVIKNGGAEPDELIGASSPLAGSAGLSETYVVTGASASAGMGMGASPSPGSYAMRQVQQVDIAAASSTELKPTGFHVMLMGLTGDLPDGAIEVTLVFKRAGSVTVQAQVRLPAPSPIQGG